MSIEKIKPNIEFIQYLRGIAALAVLAAHSLEHPLGLSSRNILVTGRIGVILFFVISGFIMVIVTGNGQFNTKSFLVKRFVRIVPYYWIVTLFTATIAIVAPFAFKATTVTLTHVFSSLLFFPFNPHGGSLPIVKLGWTLNYEIFFYVVFSMLAVFSLRKRLVLLLTLFIILVAIGQTGALTNSALKFYTNFILVSFLCGAVFGAAYLKFNKIAVTSRYLIAPGALAVVCLFTSYFNERDLDYISPKITLIMITLCCCVLSIGLWVENRGKLIESRILTICGDASYSIYLTHLFGVGFAVVLAKKLSIPTFGLGYGVIVTMGFVLGLIFGLLSYFLVEKPVIHRTRILIDHSKVGATP